MSTSVVLFLGCAGLVSFSVVFGPRSLLSFSPIFRSAVGLVSFSIVFDPSLCYRFSPFSVHKPPPVQLPASSRHESHSEDSHHEPPLERLPACQ